MGLAGMLDSGSSSDQLLLHLLLSVQIQPHLHHLLSQFPRKRFIYLLRGIRSRRRFDGLANLNLQLLEQLYAAAAAPSLLETIDGHWDNWRLNVRRKNCGALLECSRL